MGLIYLDSCLVIYLAEKHERWAGALRALMDPAKEDRYGISSLVKFECLVGPLKRADSVLHRAYIALFDDFVLLDMPESVFLQAAELRARQGLTTPDALHLACAHHHRCEELWTNDSRLTRGSRGLARNIFAAR